MTTPRSINSYGGVKVNAKVIGVPSQEKSAEEDNRVAEDLAQLTRTTFRRWVLFKTETSGSSITVIAAGSHAGSGSGEHPTVTRTTTGRYTAAWAATFVDGLGATENFSVANAIAIMGVSGTTPGIVHVLHPVSGQSVSIKICTNGSDALSDIAGEAYITILTL